LIPGVREWLKSGKLIELFHKKVLGLIKWCLCKKCERKSKQEKASETAITDSLRLLETNATNQLGNTLDSKGRRKESAKCIDIKQELESWE
jgi:uncharacterized membrane protein YheB (UPF0754 family)